LRLGQDLPVTDGGKHASDSFCGHSIARLAAACSSFSVHGVNAHTLWLPTPGACKGARCVLFLRFAPSCLVRLSSMARAGRLGCKRGCVRLHAFMGRGCHLGALGERTWEWQSPGGASAQRVREAVHTRPVCLQERLLVLAVEQPHSRSHLVRSGRTGRPPARSEAARPVHGSTWQAVIEYLWLEGTRRIKAPRALDSPRLAGAAQPPDSCRRSGWGRRRPPRRGTTARRTRGWSTCPGACGT